MSNKIQLCFVNMKMHSDHLWRQQKHRFRNLATIENLQFADSPPESLWSQRSYRNVPAALSACFPLTAADTIAVVR